MRSPLRPLRLLFALSAAACAPAPLPASPPSQPPVAPAAALAPPADVTVRYDVFTGGRRVGSAVVVRHVDGSYDEDYETSDRGRGHQIHTHVEVAADGLPSRMDLGGHDYFARPVHEQCTCDAARCRWNSTDERGEGERGFYLPVQPTAGIDTLLLAAALRSRSGARLLPGGVLVAKRVASTTVSRAGQSKHLDAFELAGMGLVPAIEWFEDDDTAFGSVSDDEARVPEGWGEVIDELLELQRPLAQEWRERVARRVARRPDSLALTHARLFDPATRKVVEDATVVIDHGKVRAAARGARVPKGAEALDVHGQMVMPGLWDMHVHADDDAGLLFLAEGVTTVRDLGSDVDAALHRKARWDAGSDLGPHLLLAGFVDGRGPFEAPTKVFADTPEEAKAVVDAYAAKGYRQLKIYSSIRPELVPVLVAEAHAKGMRVSGHVPAHMIAEDAVRAGFDQLQHINFVLLDLVATRDDDTRTPLRFARVAEKGSDLDLGGPAARVLFELLARKHTVVDPTLNVFEEMFTNRPGEVTPLVAPVRTRLPPQMQRSAGGGLPVPDGMDARYRASFAKCKELVLELWRRKIPIVAGTDTWPGFGLQRELELYVEAGIDNAEVLSIATLGAARVMKLEKTTGSLAPGKDADLIVIDGDPTVRMSDIRNVVTVIKGGVVIDASAAEAALSIAPRPRG